MVVVADGVEVGNGGADGAASESFGYDTGMYAV